MALKLPAAEAADVAIQSIGCGYDMTLDLSLNNRKRHYLSDIGSNPYRNCRLIEIEEEESRDIVLPGGLLVLNVSQSITCEESESKRSRSDFLSFMQMSQQFNQDLSLSGKIPSGLFNTMFEFSGNSQKDASSTKTLAFDGVFFSLYTISLKESKMVLCDHVKKAVPSSWEPALLARFIETFGTHIIVGVEMGGKDVIYMKQLDTSSLKPDDVQKKLKAIADERFLISKRQLAVDSPHFLQNGKDLVSICKRRGGSDDRNLKHNEWLHTVQSEPDVITMSFIPITSLLNGVLGSGYLSHAINLYLCYKPPIEELHNFLEFQIPRKWEPVFSYPAPDYEDYDKTPFLVFKLFGPSLFVNTDPIDAGKMPVTGLRLYLNGKKCNYLEIHLQHLSSLPKTLQVEEDSGTGIFNTNSYNRDYYKHTRGIFSDSVCTAPVESEDEFSIVTGSQLLVEKRDVDVLFLRLRFSKLVGYTVNTNTVWDESSGQKPISPNFTEVRDSQLELYPSEAVGRPEMTGKFLKYVDTMEVTRGPFDTPGYWVVTGARLVVVEGKLSLRVKYALPQMLPK